MGHDLLWSDIEPEPKELEPPWILKIDMLRLKTKLMQNRGWGAGLHRC